MDRSMQRHVHAGSRVPLAPQRPLRGQRTVLQRVAHQRAVAVESLAPGQTHGAAQNLSHS